MMAAVGNEVPLRERQANARVDLRMVLVGKTGSGKSAAGNTILGREDFESRASPESVTKSCRTEVVILEGKTITVTDAPGVFDMEVTNEALRRELEKLINLTASGPRVFLLVVSLGVRYNREEKDAVQWICDNFGEEALKYTVVLFTHTDVLKGTPLEQYFEQSAGLRKLISDCGGRFHGFNNNERNPNQVTELMQKIERMVEKNRVRGKENYTNDMFETAQKVIEAKIKIEKAKDIALGVASGVGVAAAASGGIVLGVTKLVVAPAVLIGAGVAAGVGGAVTLGAKKISENRKIDNARKNM